MSEKRYPRKCPVCKKDYTAKSKKSEVCSDACRARRRKARVEAKFQKVRKIAVESIAISGIDVKDIKVEENEIQIQEPDEKIRAEREMLKQRKARDRASAERWLDEMLFGF